MIKFGDFIEKLDLIDIPMSRSKYTWFKLEDSVITRLDNFLLSGGIINRWKIACQFVGDMDLYDHCS